MTEQQKKTLGLAIASLVFGCLVIIPILGLLFSLTALVLGIVAMIKINKNKDTLTGEGLAIAGMVLGGIGVLLLPIFALLAAIAIPNLLRARLSANEAMASVHVRTLSTALESYKAANDGQYPFGESALTDATPPYIDQALNGKTISGYTYSVTLNSDAYSIVASPENCGTTGMKAFRVGTDGVVQEEFCTPSGAGSV